MCLQLLEEVSLGMSSSSPQILLLPRAGVRMTSLPLLKLTTPNEGLNPQTCPHLPHILFHWVFYFILVVGPFK